LDKILDPSYAFQVEERQNQNGAEKKLTLPLIKAYDEAQNIYIWPKSKIKIRSPE
jgi:hypothetical protein